MCVEKKQDLLTTSTYTGQDVAVVEAYIESVSDVDVLELIRHIMINGGRVTPKRQRKGMYLSIY